MKTLLTIALTVFVIFSMGCEATKLDDDVNQIEKVDLSLASDVSDVVTENAQLVVKKADGSIEQITMQSNENSFFGELDASILDEAKDVQLNLEVPELENVQLQLSLNDEDKSAPTLEITGLTFTSGLFGNVEVKAIYSPEGPEIVTNDSTLNVMIAAAGFTPGKEVTQQSLFNAFLNCNYYAPSILDNDSLAKVILQKCLSQAIVDKQEPLTLTDMGHALACSPNIGTLLDVEIPTEVTEICKDYQPDARASVCAENVTTINFKKLPPKMTDVEDLYDHCYKEAM